MQPVLPDWIFEGLCLKEEHEVLHVRARAAWRHRDMAEIARLLELRQALALRAATAELQIEHVRASVRTHKKTVFTTARVKA